MTEVGSALAPFSGLPAKKNGPCSLGDAWGYSGRPYKRGAREILTAGNLRARELLLVGEGGSLPPHKQKCIPRS